MTLPRYLRPQLNASRSDQKYGVSADSPSGLELRLDVAFGSSCSRQLIVNRYEEEGTKSKLGPNLAVAAGSSSRKLAASEKRPREARARGRDRGYGSTRSAAPPTSRILAIISSASSRSSPSTLAGRSRSARRATLASTLAYSL